MLEGRTPDDAAREMVRRSQLARLGARRALWQGGRAAVEASRDPFVAMWRRILPEVTAVRKRYEAEVAEPLAQADTQIGQARFEVLGIVSETFVRRRYA